MRRSFGPIRAQIGGIEFGIGDKIEAVLVNGNAVHIFQIGGYRASSIGASVAVGIGEGEYIPLFATRYVNGAIRGDCNLAGVAKIGGNNADLKPFRQP
uniref:Uncharacterized protein n=1 Tax=Desertifilum tharense IPPAS B-1220 TaxID=1781255 RepID=A0ACD5GU98_9CYAN